LVDLVGGEGSIDELGACSPVQGRQGTETARQDERVGCLSDRHDSSSTSSALRQARSAAPRGARLRRRTSMTRVDLLHASTHPARGQPLSGKPSIVITYAPCYDPRNSSEQRNSDGQVGPAA